MNEQYRAFYLEYKSRLFRYLVYKCGDNDVARDITQESFARYIQHYGGAATLSPALLFTIARNALVDVHRYHYRFPQAEVTPASGSPPVEEQLIVRERTARVRTALAQLSDLDREVLVMAVGGLPYKEIAGALDISLTNVKVRVHRARTQLREIMAEDGE